MPAGSGGAQETVGCGNIRADEQWKPCVGAVKKAPGREEGRSGYPDPLTCSVQHTLQRERERQQVQCVPFIETQESVCVCMLLCLYVCVPTAESC